MDWVTISGLATAFGTLVLAIATFGAIRSANRSAQAAERSVAAGLRPMLIGSREHDPPQKVGFADQHFLRVDGGQGAAELAEGVVYLAMSLRNVGAGVAVLHGWTIAAAASSDMVTERPDPSVFRRLTRDIYVPAGDVGFWEGALRDRDDPALPEVRGAIEDHRPITVHLLYGDVEGGQRVISRFALIPVREGRWLATMGRHWNIDRPDPR